jgi:hypothetical protein
VEQTREDESIQLMGKLGRAGVEGPHLGDVTRLADDAAEGFYRKDGSLGSADGTASPDRSARSSRKADLVVVAVPPGRG